MSDARRWPIRIVLTGVQTSDDIGARALVDDLPAAEVFPADRGYDADWFRKAQKDNGMALCIPSKKVREVPIPMTLNAKNGATRSETALLD